MLLKPLLPCVAFALAFQPKQPLPAAAFTSYSLTLRFADAEIPETLSPSSVTLKYAPMPAASLQFYRNGRLEIQNVDYTLAENKLTLLAPARIGDKLIAWYRY